MKQDGDSGEEEEVANKVKLIVGFEAFPVNNGLRQSGVMNLTACTDLLRLAVSPSKSEVLNISYGGSEMLDGTNLNAVKASVVHAFKAYNRVDVYFYPFLTQH